MSEKLNPCHPENVHMGVSGGYLGHALARRVQNALLTNGWIAATMNAFEVQARSELDRARAITPDTSRRRKRIAEHQAQAHQYALHVAALRELLRFRQEVEAAGRAALENQP